MSVRIFQSKDATEPLASFPEGLVQLKHIQAQLSITGGQLVKKGSESKGFVADDNSFFKAGDYYMVSEE